MQRSVTLGRLRLRISMTFAAPTAFGLLTRIVILVPTGSLRRVKVFSRTAPETLRFVNGFGHLLLSDLLLVLQVALNVDAA